MTNVLDISNLTTPKKMKNPLDGKTYFVYNISDGLANYSQMKSQYVYSHNQLKRNGYYFCNVTMISMGLIYSGIYDRFQKEIDKIYPELPRLPDKLAKFIFESDIARAYYKKRFKHYFLPFERGEKDALAPNEIHNILSYMTNLFVDAGVVTYFSSRTPLESIIFDIIYNGTPVGVSGKFANLDHMVLAVGLAYDKLMDNNEPEKYQIPNFIIIDDPFGKTYEYNKGLSGNDVFIPFNRFVSDLKPLDNQQFKFAHRFIKPNRLGI